MPEQVNPDNIDENEQDKPAELLVTVSSISNRVDTLQLTVDTVLRILRNIAVILASGLLAFMLASLVAL